MHGMKKFLSLCLVVLGIAALTGCRKAPKEEEIAADAVVLVKMSNKPVLTKTKFHNLLKGFVGKMDPALLPKNTQEKLLKNWLQIELAVRAAEKEGVVKDEEFVKLYTEQKEHLKRELLFRFYDNRKYKTMDVSKDEMKNHYDKNKYLYEKEPGGVAVRAVVYKDAGKAKPFYDSIKGNMAEFDSLGKKEKDGKFRDLGRVGARPGGYNMVPNEVREAALKLAKLPAVEFVKTGKDVWVISVSDKKDPIYYDYEDIEERIEKQLKLNKYMKVREDIYKKLEKDFKVEINREYFVENAQGAPLGSAPLESAPLGNQQEDKK